MKKVIALIAGLVVLVAGLFGVKKLFFEKRWVE